MCRIPNVLVPLQLPRLWTTFPHAMLAGQRKQTIFICSIQYFTDNWRFHLQRETNKSCRDNRPPTARSTAFLGPPAWGYSPHFSSVQHQSYIWRYFNSNVSIYIYKSQSAKFHLALVQLRRWAQKGAMWTKTGSVLNGQHILWLSPSKLMAAIHSSWWRWLKVLPLSLASNTEAETKPVHQPCRNEGQAVIGRDPTEGCTRVPPPPPPKSVFILGGMRSLR